LNKDSEVSEFGNLDSLRAVVTGSSSGIGRAIALELAAAGADVVVHCRESIEQAENVAAEIRSIGRRAAIVRGDVGDASKLGQLVDAAWEAFGGVDIWVNNAGVDLLTGDNAKLPYAEKLEALLDVDVRSTVLLSKMVGERMAAQGGGTILNIGWDQSDRGMGGDSGELFATAKNAIMGFTRSLAVSLAPTVRVNCIAPGWIRTAWGEQASDPWQERVLQETPLNRWGTPEDIAKLARFLVSPDASYITGQVINCNGGAVR
jgi:3-oxoacyl-[acyl-carrier protein] reductase